MKGRRCFVPSSQYDMVCMTIPSQSIAYEESLALPFLYHCTSLYHFLSYYAVPVYLQTHLQDCRSTTGCLKQLAMLIGGAVLWLYIEPVLKRTQVVSSAASPAQVEMSCKKFALGHSWRSGIGAIQLFLMAQLQQYLRTFERRGCN